MRLAYTAHSGLRLPRTSQHIQATAASLLAGTLGHAITELSNGIE
ncbi:hypothetical protein B0G71_2576 [Paraburkholderia sp. BL27I4N3]|nr:hypothetical protein B0G71_2576 [Paraburkholderia sp. BL27I4N3]